MLAHCSINTRKRIAYETAIFAVCGIVSCGGGHISLDRSISTQAPGFTISPQVISFGSVTLGASKSSSVTLTDSSPQNAPELAVDKIALSGSGFKVKSPRTPIALTGGQSLSFSVTFTPASAGTTKGRLSLSLNRGSSAVQVEVSGTGMSQTASDVPKLSVSPATMDFGTVMVGHSADRRGLLTAGTADVNISTATWDGPDYSLSGITLPMTLHAGRSVRFTVSLTPHSVGSENAQLSFFSDASSSPIVTLSGSAAQASQHSVELSWSASTSPVAGYNIYRRTNSGAYKRLNRSPDVSLTYTDDTTETGSTYHYVVTALNPSGRESRYSNEATAKIP